MGRTPVAFFRQTTLLDCEEFMGQRSVFFIKGRLLLKHLHFFPFNEGWGEQGYFRIIRNKGKCGVNTQVVTSILAWENRFWNDFKTFFY
jgi:hypothetical protein